ncbi:methyl-accepting chemotaxis protein [Halanaerocella petrolearia]
MLAKLKLKQKLMIAMVALAVVPVLIYGIVSYNNSQNMIKNKVIERNNLLAQQMSSQIQDKVSGLAKTVNILSEMDKVKSMNLKQHRKIFDKYLNKYSLFQYLYVANKQGELVSFSVETEHIGESFSHRPWFKEAMKDTIYISDSYISAETDKPCITISTPIKEQGKIVGVLGVDISLVTLQQMVNNVNLGESGEIYITDSQGVVIAHPNENMVLEQANNKKLMPVKRALSGKYGSAIYSNKEKEDMLASYYSLKGLGWSLVVQQSTKKAFSELQGILIRNIVIVLIAGAVASGVAAWLALSFSRPILELVATMRNKARGDLTVNLDLDRSDELGILADAFSRGTKQQRRLVTSIIDTSEDLSAYSEELSASAQEGNAIIETNNQNLEEITASIDQISASSQEVTSLAQEASSQAQVGNQNIQQTLSSMEDINQTVTKAVTVINELDNKSQEIDQIVEMISNIADQTNLLALNAAIEAARASSTDGTCKGGQGQGFAVVADEIRELANETTQATEKIADLIQETQAKSKAGLEFINQVEDKVESGKEVARETEEVFAQIKNAIQETSAQIQQTAAGAQNLAQNSNQAKKASEEINSMSQEVTYSAQELAELAQELQNLVERFKVN